MPPVPGSGSVEGMKPDASEAPEWIVTGAYKPLGDEAISPVAKILVEQAEAELREEAHD